MPLWQAHSLNIANLHQEDSLLSLNFVYVYNRVRFIATDQQEREIIRKLYATGLVVDVERCVSDANNPHKMTDSPRHQVDPEQQKYKTDLQLQ